MGNLSERNLDGHIAAAQGRESSAATMAVVVREMRSLVEWDKVMVMRIAFAEDAVRIAAVMGKAKTTSGNLHPKCHSSLAPTLRFRVCEIRAKGVADGEISPRN